MILNHHREHAHKGEMTKEVKETIKIINVSQHSETLKIYGQVSILPVLHRGHAALLITYCL